MTEDRRQLPDLKLSHGGSGGACPGKLSLEPPRYAPSGEPIHTRRGIVQCYHCEGCGAGLTVVFPSEEHKP